jgi:RimJ/RimL family protein N-acetyltransferase
VKADRPAGLSLHVFSRNVPARRFYEAVGFVLVEEGDGSDNAEGEPDCTYLWRGSSE